MKRAKAAALIAAAVLATSLAVAAQAQDGERGIVVAAAADLQFVLPEIAEFWQRIHPEIPVRITFGSSGNLFAQISNGAPFDLFLSADERYPRELVKQGKALAEDLTYYGTGRLVLWMPGSSFDPKGEMQKAGLRVLLDPSIRRIAIANPDHAPYGVAAVEALRHYGIYEAITPRLVRGDTATQAAQFAQSGGAGAGLIPLSLALSAPMRASGRHWVVPAEAHARIEQTGIALRGSRQIHAAKSFCAFLVGTEARAALERFGFEPPVKH